MPRRVFVEKKPGFDVEARQLSAELAAALGLAGLERVRIVKRYDVEGIDGEVFARCLQGVFAEPPVDTVSEQAPPLAADERAFAVEPLPGQFDQRADSCAECIQLVCAGPRPQVRTADVYILRGRLSDEDLGRVKDYVVNPVETRKASPELPETLCERAPEPGRVETLSAFTRMGDDELAAFVEQRALAISTADLACVRAHFAAAGREPTITELRVIDTYWSDHCRHTTFNTRLEGVEIDDDAVRAAFERYLGLRRELGREGRPVTLMDMGTIAARWLKAGGRLADLDESEEVNACTVKAKVDVDGRDEDWLVLFKNETHNHPTEIEPFGGAATCIGGCIRDPLSGRAWVYQAMRVSGAGDPRTPYAETWPGKLPQRKICVEAAAGYSGYGNQIGLATGQVCEIYHPGYVAKRMEIGAVVGAAPAANVVREAPVPGDVVVLVGGRTGRDGIGGATGSSKAQDTASVATLGAEVQKGNAPAERKIQRLFRRGEATRLVKRCNDFGAGGVAVAVGELADGLDIDLDAVPRKYEGLDGTELAISESQERMAVVLGAGDVEEFCAYAREENLEATPIARVTAEPRLRMRWHGDAIVDIDRAFLDTNGAPRVQSAHVPEQGRRARGKDAAAGRAAQDAGGAEAARPHVPVLPEVPGHDAACVEEGLRALLADPNVACAKGLVERFDSSIGAAGVLAPLGGTRQLAPVQAMVAKLPVAGGKTQTASGMSWGFNPYISEASPYLGAYLAVLESVARLVATGFGRAGMHLSFQEYFEKLREAPERWGKPVAALLGALDAQLDLGVAAIGGKDSMSGSFEDLDVPPTLVSFAVGLGRAGRIVSPELKGAGHRLVLVAPAYRADGRPEADTMLEALDLVEAAIAGGQVLACATCGFGGPAEALFKMCVGNRVGVHLAEDAFDHGGPKLFEHAYGAFALELADGAALPAARKALVAELGTTTEAYTLHVAGEHIDLAALEEVWTSALEGVYPWQQAADDEAVAGEGEAAVGAAACDDEGAGKGGAATGASLAPDGAGGAVRTLSFTEKLPLTCPSSFARPRVVIPVFPGTNCEFDSADAWRAAGAEPEVFVVNNLTPAAVAESGHALAEAIGRSQIAMLCGGFSGGDEPDGAAKLIASFFRNPQVAQAVRALLADRDGLMLGICNGFQALVKLGLVPFGEIVEPAEDAPTLTFNTIGRHVSRIVHTSVASTLSPWLARCAPGEVHAMPVSCGEGRFVAKPEVLERLAATGQLATQYCDENGRPSMDLQVNPTGSLLAVEGATSPDGRVFGKMGHVERSGADLYRNVPGLRAQPLFAAGVDYFA